MFQAKGSFAQGFSFFQRTFVKGDFTQKMKSPDKSKLLFPIGFSFDSQQFHVVIKFSCISRLKHYPFPITIGLGFIILFTNSIRNGFPYILKFCPLIFPKNNHETNTIIFCV